ncbi:hypothetical protein HMPREF1705_02776 [Acetomicrobium hydrogeniformans ATCC BAA-1850]|jgi:hypothetical protein|uniref:Uncharacterized protein n=2 Tax=Acetomicrobium TaxID=49894 RepID=A0A0T5XAY3_9BACT|nr:hypothetical protein HMPREF1705_02776 [Acetomicrobium hydrogeniformans ATCC BAA-1850]
MKMTEWYVKGLLAYMLGLKEEEIEELIDRYLQEVGEEDPRTLFVYLMKECKDYMAIWTSMSFSNQITILAAAIVGPDSQVIWTSQTALPYSAKDITLEKWSTVANILSKGAGTLPASVNEAEFIAAQHASQQLRKVWPEVASDAYNVFLQSNENASVSESFLPKEKLIEYEKKIREATGRTIPIISFKIAKLSLPELREKSVNLTSLDPAITRYLNRVTKNVDETGSYAVDASSDENASLLEIDPVIDAVNGTPLSELRPGDVIFLAKDESEAIGQIFMVRLLKNGQYEIHGILEDDDREDYFRFIAPGDIKVKTPQSHAKVGLDLRLILALIFVVILFVALLFLPF